VVESFNAIVGVDEVENPKPPPDSILFACERCGCLPFKAIYVGDQPSDMEAGKAARVVAVVAICPEGVALIELADLIDFIVESVGIIVIC
jgi:phosphoglycolate phosphatase-like HAD superfamily hydrolase